MAQNPTPTPGEFKRDVGSGEQLPAGEATELNDQLAFGDEVEELIADQSKIPLPDTGPPSGLGLGGVSGDVVEDVEFDDSDDVFEPSDEDEEILFGPAEGIKPSEPPSGVLPLPGSVVRRLPSLMALAMNPRTPPAIKAAVKIAVRALEQEQLKRYAMQE